GYGSDQVGRVLGGRYRLLAPVGAGASAAVYLADDVQLQRRVAVKLLHASLAGDPAFAKRFRAEAQAAAALNHPNVLAVYDWGEESGIAYLVTEFLGGGSLRSVLDRGRTLSPSQALVVGLEACKGLNYAHRRGLVHRDIKPANLLFGEDGRLRIADFGLARAIAEAAWTEPAGVVLGTARYASPEQATGKAVDGKTDVYSLALTLVEAVTGEVPFAADTTVATLMNRVDKLLPVSAEMGALAPVLERAGRPDPAERFSAAELGKALHEAASRLPRPQPLPLVATLPSTPGADETMQGLPGAAGFVVAGVSTKTWEPAPMPEPERGAVSADEPVEAVPVSGDDLSLPTWVGPAGVTGAAGAGSGGSQSLHEQLASLPRAPVAADERSAGDPTRAMKQPTPPMPPTTVAPAVAAHEEPLPRKRRRGLRWVLLILLALLLAAGGAVGALLWQRSQTESYLVPNVVGVDETTARGLLEPNGWVVSTVKQRDDTQAAGVVFRQDPQPGLELEEGERFTIFLSEGPTLTPVPAIVGRPVADAQAAMDAAKLVLVVADRRYDESAEKDIILASTVNGQPVEAGAQIPKGTQVDAVVSLGPAPRSVPNVVGKTYDQAKAELEALGLVAARQPDAFSDTVKTGLVISTDPTPGKQVARGATVNIVVSKGPDLVTVPQVVGQTQEAATATL
ncbi:MAG TPA: PASTA domain-containing protein, partial [Acidimicrobiales bacterium]